MIHENSLNLLYNLFKQNQKENLTICFLSECSELFYHKILIEHKFKEIAFDSIFENEISSFNSILFMRNSQLNNKWRIICPCISGYLIKESYFKLSENRIKKFFSEQNNFSKMNLDESEYIVLRYSSSGSTNFIYLIYHIREKKLFAFKRQSEIISELYKRELKNYLKLSHPFIPKFYGFIKNENILIIEFINGQTLLNIERIQLTINEKFTIIFEIMIVLEFIHRNKFIYRDLKPDNVMIDKNKTVALIDFDRMLNFDDESRSIDSSQFFASPEIQTENLSSASDVYSFGKMIYYIIEEECQITNETKELDKYPELKNIYERCINRD